MGKILVTGASGYLGGCVFNALNQDKANCVHRLAGRLKEIKPHSLNYELVVHCAGALRYRKGLHQESNVQGTKNLISGLNQETKLIYISSKSIYGSHLEGLFSEKNAPQPDDDYGKTKYEGELAILNSGLPYIILRPSTLFGLGVHNMGSVFPAKAMLDLYKGKDIKLYTPDVLHEYLYVKDLVQIILKIKEMPACWNQIFNASGRQEPLSALVYSIEDYLKESAQPVGRILKTPQRASKSFYLDSTKLWNAMGEQICSPTEVVIQGMGEYIKANYSLAI